MKSRRPDPRFSSWFLILLAACLAPSSGHAQALLDITAVRQEAKTRYRSGNYDEATRLYHELVKLKPGDVEVLKEAMWGFWNMGHYDEAASIASEVRAVQPDDPEAKNILSWAPHQQDKKDESSLRREAIASYQAGHYEDSARLYRELAQMEPNNIAILKEFMWALWNIERYDEAERIARRISALRPTETEAHDVLQRAPEQLSRQKVAELEKEAKVYEDAGQKQEAIALYKRLVEVDPQNPLTIRTMIWALTKEKQYEDAKTYAFQLMALRPRDPESWNMLAKVQLASGQTEEGIQSYQKSLTLKAEQPEVLLSLGKYYTMIRQFETAIGYLQDAVKLNSALLETYPLLGKAYFFSGHYAQARDAWTQAVARYPQESEYRFNRAQALYFEGDADGAIAEMKDIAATSKNQHAEDFIVDDLTARGEVSEAEARLEEMLHDMHPVDESEAMKLAAMYQADGRNSHLEILLDRFLKVWPDHQPSLLMKGSLLYDEGRYAESEKVYALYRRVNPYATGALLGLEACDQALGREQALLQTIDELRRLEPTEPHYLLAQAQALYESGRHDSAKRLLLHWLKTNKGSPVLPIVLYHGLTPRERDPMLAYPYHYTVRVFEDHMRAIHDAGYTPVTVEDVTEWLAGHKKLPARPILIAFDDNRRDSFQNADPVLEKYHLKATMFVAITNVEYHQPPAFVSWDELSAYQQSGRWELQSHGDIAHIHIPVNAQGGEGLFLINRKWMADENRMETIEEWKQRIATDHQSSVDKMTQHTGYAPVGYAWPEGLFGQQGSSNDPETLPINLALVQKYFKAAFTQDHFGLNVRTTDPLHMTRFIPNNTWSGQDLLRHFSDQNPFALIYLQLLEWSNEEGHTREALHWLTEMRESGVSAPILLSKESEIRFSAGDLATGEALTARLSMMENNAEVQKSLKTAQTGPQPDWTPSFTYHNDNSHRIGREFFQTLEFPTLKNITWRLDHFYGRYSEPGVASITDNGVGAGLDAKLGLFHTLSLDAMGHFLPDTSNTTVTGAGALESKWTDTFKTQISGGRTLFASARALDANILVDYGQVVARWIDAGWDATVRGRGASLSDDNRRWLGQGTLARDLDATGRLKGVARFTYDDMKDVSPNYYSPQHLRLYELGPEFSDNFSKRFNFYVRCLPGYGIEQGTNGQLAADVETRLRIRMGESTSLTPAFEYERTPTFYENIYSVEFKYVF